MRWRCRLKVMVDGSVHAEKRWADRGDLNRCSLMRILRPTVLSKPLLMRTGQSETAERRGVGAQFVGDQQFRSACASAAVQPGYHASYHRRRSTRSPALGNLKCTRTE